MFFQQTFELVLSTFLIIPIEAIKLLENKEAFSTRMRLEAEKNKLENLLTNNLMRRKDELMQVQYTMDYVCIVRCERCDTFYFLQQEVIVVCF